MRQEQWRGYLAEPAQSAVSTEQQALAALPDTASNAPSRLGERGVSGSGTPSQNQAGRESFRSEAIRRSGDYETTPPAADELQAAIGSWPKESRGHPGQSFPFMRLLFGWGR